MEITVPDPSLKWNIISVPNITSSAQLNRGSKQSEAKRGCGFLRGEVRWRSQKGTSKAMQIRRGKATGVVLVPMEEKILAVGEEVRRTLT